MPRPHRTDRKDVGSKRMIAEDARPAVSGAASPSPAGLWAYTYHIVPRQTSRQLRGVKALLEQEHSDAKSDSATFGGRLIGGTQGTRILIVSDCPDRSCDVNQRLESELRQLQAEFTVSDPVLLADEEAAPSPAPTSTPGGTP